MPAKTCLSDVAHPVRVGVSRKDRNDIRKKSR
ncbi:Uncharacterised protein [Bordetella pertussis]|nr:Uncharacterised protein [Bordetella pertussis]